MNRDRRRFMGLTAGMIATGAPVSLAGSGITAVAFDAFPIFDPRPAFAALVREVPNHGERLQQLFFDRLFAYSWLRTAGGRYKNFTGLMDDALRFAAMSLALPLSAEARHRVIGAFFALPVWPDVRPALGRLRARGIRLGFLSNMTEAMLRANMRANGIEEDFAHVLSTDRAQAFKPHPDAYALALEGFGLPRARIAFAAFAGWDAAGASWFGYPTVWVNRLNAPAEALDAPPLRAQGGLEEVVRLAHA